MAHPDENPSAEGTFVYNPRFPGQVFDGETNNHYNYFRDYDPQTGRYIQSDPIGLKGGINTYGYVEADPVGKVDPLGLQSEGDLSPRPGRLPGPFDILTPGTPANNDFVRSVSRLIKNVKDTCSSNDLPREECKKDALLNMSATQQHAKLLTLGMGNLDLLFVWREQATTLDNV
jgi:RHS repeat-associated protein